MRRYGIELDAFRAEQARGAVDELIDGNRFDVQSPVESLSSQLTGHLGQPHVRDADCSRT